MASIMVLRALGTFGDDPVTVEYEFYALDATMVQADGSPAAEAADFVAARGTLSFGRGQANRTISMQTVQDAVAEIMRGGAVRTEAVGLRLQAAAGGARVAAPTDFGLQSSAVLLIVDDDIARVESANVVEQTEGTTDSPAADTCLLFGAESATVMLTRTVSAAAGTAEIMLSVASPGEVPGAGQAGADYAAGVISSVSVSFAAGETSAVGILPLRAADAPLPAGEAADSRRRASLVVTGADIDTVTGLDIRTGATIASDGESIVIGTLCFGASDETVAVEAPSDANRDGSDNSSDGVSGGLIAGVVVGVLVVAAVGVGLAYYVFGASQNRVGHGGDGKNSQGAYKVTSGPSAQMASK